MSSVMGPLVVVESAQYPIISCDQDLQIVEVNRAVCGQLGMDQEDLLGKKLDDMDVLHPTEFPRLKQMFSLLASGREITPRLRVRLKDDGYIVIQPIELPVKLSGADDSLGKLSEGFGFIFDNIQDGIAILQDNLLRYFNNRMKTICDGGEQLYFTPFIELIHDDDRQIWESFFNRCTSENLDNKTPMEIYSIRAVTHKSNVRSWNIRLANFTWQGQPAVLLLVDDVSSLQNAKNSIDQTNRALAEIQLFKTRLMSRVDHMLNESLTSIQDNGEMLNATTLTADQKTHVDSITGSSSELLGMISMFHDYTAIETNHSDIKHYTFKLRATIEQIISDMMPQAMDRGLMLTALFHHDVPAWVKGDPIQFKRTLVILIDNALKYTQQGGVVVEVNSTGQDNLVRFSVMDTGPGLVPEEINTIFEPFSNGKDSGEGSKAGIGLGLVLAKKTVEILGGEIEVTSTIGQGSRFSFVLPFTVSKDTTLDLPEEVSLKGTRILLLDEDKEHSRAIKEMLLEWECLVDEASDGEKALEKFNAAAEAGQPINIALLDVLMRKISGPDLAKQIKSNLETRNTSLVLMTDMPRSGDCERISKVGFSGYMMKPMQKEQLKDLLMLLIRMDIADRYCDNPHRMITVHTLKDMKTDQPRLLVVEDDPVLQEIVIRVMEKAGYVCDLAENGLKGLIAAKSRFYHLIMMDIHMPEMDGLEATRQIRAYENANQQYTPIIAMTVDSDCTIRGRCKAAGMNGFIPKPLTRDSLESIVKTHVCLANCVDSETRDTQKTA